MEVYTTLTIFVLLSIAICLMTFTVRRITLKMFVFDATYN